MKQILILFFVFFLAISLVHAANLVLNPSTINVNIFSGENKTFYMYLTSQHTGYVHIYSNVTQNTSNLEGFNFTYPNYFKVEANRRVTIPVSIWLDERFGPNNVTIKFWAVQKVGSGGGSGGINITIGEYKNETIKPNIPANQTNQTQPVKPPIEPTEKKWYNNFWLWFWIILAIIITALIIAYIIWRRKQEINAEYKELNKKQEVKQK